MKKIKIMHIITNLGTGGAELTLMRLIAYSDKSKYEHRVISLKKIASVGEKMSKLDINVVYLNLNSFFSYPATILNLVKIIFSYEPDIVQTWLFRENIIGGLVAKICRVKNIIWSFRTESYLNQNKILGKFFIKVSAFLSYIIPNKIVSCASSSCNQHVAWGYSKSIMEVIHNGYDINKYFFDRMQRSNIRKKYCILENELLIGIVGRFQKEKNYGHFISAASILFPLNKSIKFLMVGKNLDKNNFILNKLINETSCPERFILVGEQENLNSFYSAMDVFCLCSLAEGFPNVLAEAMAAGLPCVSTNVGEVPYLLMETGIMVERNNLTDLVEGLQKMIGMTHQDRLNIGMTGKKRIKDFFTVDKMVNKFEYLYENMLFLKVT